ncbi:hypothetical protein M422DRAFT_27757 [Sphaerobolus stellatus SS14]|nr:hypothetical protein M422DRAFT_27757 [Sphaerobolus stellatus SS14]
MSKSLFILGATGYIGGSVLKGVLSTFSSQFTVTALVRSSSQFDAVRSFGVDNIIHGSHEDLELVKSQSAKSDVVINCADADDLPLTMAVLAGLKARSGSGEGESKPILIHTSGTGVVADQAEGEFIPSAHKIWNDNNEDDIRSIPPEQPHRLIDLEIFHADENGYLSAYIIAPSCIYGTGTGPVNKLSQQVPGAIRIAIKRKEAVYIGKGTNKWNNVHILDLVSLYTLVLQHALSLNTENTEKTSPYAKFFFGSVQEHVWGDVIRQIGQILHEKGVLEAREAKSVTLDAVPSLRWVANNSRSSSDRGFALGWRPKAPAIEETLEEDVLATLQKDGVKINA